MPDSPTIARNREKIVPAAVGILILAVAFLLCYEPWFLGLRELFRLEGFYATQTLEMDWRLPLATAHGVAIQNAFPFYPWLCNLALRVTGLEIEWTMRLVSIAMTGFGTWIVYFTVRRSRSVTGALAAAAMFFSANIVIEKAMDAYPTSTVAFGLLAAQLVWFYFGVRRSNWNAAWFCSAAVLAPTFYAGGFAVFLYFFFPLIFMRRPLTVWPKLNKIGMYAALALLTATIFLWYLPYRMLGDEISLHYWVFGQTSPAEYLEQLLTWPLDVVVRFLPWGLISWAPFCVALQGLDDTPIFSRYLRTIVISTFFLLWLLPDTAALELVYLAGPMAILTGLYYEMAVRRYSRQIRVLLVPCAIAVLAVAAALVLLVMVPEPLIGRFVRLSYSIAYKNSLPYLALALTAAGLSLAAGLYILFGSRRNPVWLLLLLTTVVMGGFFWVAMYPYRLQANGKREFGEELRKALAVDRSGKKMPQILYKSNILDLYGECLYLGIPVKKLASLEDLPKADDTVYLLSTEFPQYPERNWINLLPPDKTYLQHRVRLWRGDLRRNTLQPQTLEPPREAF